MELLAFYFLDISSYSDNIKIWKEKKVSAKEKDILLFV